MFGSVARGEADPDSDIDLLVIVDDDTPEEKVTLKAGVESRQSYHHPADVIPVHEATFQRKSKIANPSAGTDAGVERLERHVSVSG